MPDSERSGVDAFNVFREYLETEVAPLLPAEKREEVLDSIVRAAYTFGGALLRRGAGGAGDFLAFRTRQADVEEDKEELEDEPARQADNVVGFPPARLASQEQP